MSEPDGELNSSRQRPYLKVFEKYWEYVPFAILGLFLYWFEWWIFYFFCDLYKASPLLRYFMVTRRCRVQHDYNPEQQVMGLFFVLDIVYIFPHYINTMGAKCQAA